MARLMERSSLGLGLSNLRQFWWLMCISQLDDPCTVSLDGRRAERISLIPSDNWDWRTASYKSLQYIYIVINVRITCSLSLWNNHLGNECTPKQYCIVIRYVIRLFTISILPVTFSLIKLPRRLGKLAESINSTCLVYKVIFDSVPDFLPPEWCTTAFVFGRILLYDAVLLHSLLPPEWCTNAFVLGRILFRTELKNQVEF